MLQAIEQAKIGDVVPVYKVVENIDALEYFAKISDYGRNKNAILFEFNEKIIGSIAPCLKLTGYKGNFEITALNALGKKFLAFIKNDFKFCNKVQYIKNKIIGNISVSKRAVSEDQRLRLKSHMDVIAQVAFKFKPTLKPFAPYCGLFGIFSYDIIEHFEDLPESSNEPYYEFYFLDNLFVMDKGRIYFIANALIMDDKKEKLYRECLKTIENYEKILKRKLPKAKKYKAKEHIIDTDTEKAEFEAIVQKIKKSILEGNIYQAFPSRTIISNYNSEPFDIYKELRKLKFPYMFYVNTESGILLGASPEMSLRVEGDEEKTIEIRQITAAKPRGFNKEDIDVENRYEAELKIDFKEIAKHIMAIDLIRNDISRVAKLGTRHLAHIFVAEKYSNEQHLVSSVKGILKKDLNALHAYISCMNRLSGCPKIEAIRLLRQIEKSRRGYFFGSVCYLNPNKEFSAAIVKNAIRLKNKKAFINVNADIVYDTIAEMEFKSTEKKAKICLEAIRAAGGLR